MTTLQIVEKVAQAADSMFSIIYHLGGIGGEDIVRASEVFVVRLDDVRCPTR